jgi:carbonyl reductase 1
VLVYLTARDQAKGEAALNELHNDPQLKAAKALKTDGGSSEIKFHALDITDSTSVRLFADHIKHDHVDGIDFLINNAGIAMTGFGESSLHYSHNPGSSRVPRPQCRENNSWL